METNFNGEIYFAAFHENCLCQLSEVFQVLQSAGLALFTETCQGGQQV